MHMLRDMVTGLSGDAITSTSQGSFFSKTYTYSIPQNFKAIPFELLDAEEGFHSGYTDMIMPNVMKAQKLPLAEDYDSAIIDAFTT